MCWICNRKLQAKFSTKNGTNRWAYTWLRIRYRSLKESQQLWNICAANIWQDREFSRRNSINREKWGLEEIYDKGNGPEAVFRSTGYKGSSPFVQRVIGVKVHGVRNYVLFVDETTSDWRTLICENLRLLLNDLEKNGTVHVLCSKQNSLQNEIQNAFYIQWIHQNDCSRPITKLYRGSVNEQIFYPQDLVTIGSNI